MDKKSKQYYIGAAVMFLFSFILPSFVSPWAEGITDAGVTIVLIFVGTIIGLIATNDCILAALFSMCALVYSGIFEPAGVIGAFIGNPMVWQVMTLFALSYVIVRDGTGETIARFILTRKGFQKRPLLIIAVLMITMATAAVFVGVFGALIICFVLLKSICKEADIDPNSQFGRLLYLGCFTSACVGVNIMGKMNALHWATAQFFIDGTGVDIPPYAFSLYSLVLLAVFIFVYILSMKFIFRCDMNKLSGVDLIQVLGTDNTKPSRKQLIPLLAFLLIAVYTFFYGFIPEDLPVISGLKGMENIVFGCAVMAAPDQIRSTLCVFLDSFSPSQLSIHLHDTEGFGMANAYAALECGITDFDTSLGAMGGCPVIPNAKGNIATEDFVNLLDKLGIANDVDLDKCVAASLAMSRRIGNPVISAKAELAKVQQ